MPDFLPKAPCVGENVVWFPHGDINQEPFAATVTSRINDDCITLYTLSPTGRREPMLNVKHVSHPDHDHSPQGLKRWGAWDLVGEHEKRKQKNEEQSLAKKAMALKEAENHLRVETEQYENPDEQEMVIIRISRELGDTPGRAQQVADKIGAGMTHQRVNSVLRKFQHLLKGELPEELFEANA
tara:strand:+ start:1173 stop:1721 length:549 start_codon:yes stop_codon:yes gene_type:complete